MRMSDDTKLAVATVAVAMAIYKEKGITQAQAFLSGHGFSMDDTYGLFLLFDTTCDIMKAGGPAPEVKLSD